MERWLLGFIFEYCGWDADFKTGEIRITKTSGFPGDEELGWCKITLCLNSGDVWGSLRTKCRELEDRNVLKNAVIPFGRLSDEHLNIEQLHLKREAVRVFTIFNENCSIPKESLCLMKNIFDAGFGCVFVPERCEYKGYLLIRDRSRSYPDEMNPGYIKVFSDCGRGGQKEAACIRRGISFEYEDNKDLLGHLSETLEIKKEKWSAAPNPRRKAVLNGMEAQRDKHAEWVDRLYALKCASLP